MALSLTPGTADRLAALTPLSPGRSFKGLLAGGLLLYAGTGCSPGPPLGLDQENMPYSVPEPPVVPAVDNMSITPGTLVVPAGSVFQLRAFLQDARGRAIAEQGGHVVQWAWDPGSVAGAGLAPDDLLPIVSAGHRAVVTAPKQTPTTLTLTARSGARSGNAQIQIVLPQGDMLLADHTDATPPVVGRVFGAGLPGDTVLAFVESVGTGDLTGPGEAVLLSSDRALELREHFVWTSGGDIVDFRAGPSSNVSETAAQPPVPFDSIIIIVVDAVSDVAQTRVEGVADINARLATRLFREAQAGVRVVIARGSVGSTDSIKYPGDFCSETAVTPRDTLTVVYVDYLGMNSKGWACRPGQVPDSAGIILMDWSDRTATTLAHELGHMLSLRTGKLGSGRDYGKAGHVKGPSGQTGFTPANLMATGESDKTRAQRGYLTLGQVFRMSADTSSWINLPHVALRTGPVRLCQGDPDLAQGDPDTAQGGGAAARCPKLSRRISD